MTDRPDAGEIAAIITGLSAQIRAAHDVIDGLSEALREATVIFSHAPLTPTGVQVVEALASAVYELLDNHEIRRHAGLLAALIEAEKTP